MKNDCIIIRPSTLEHLSPFDVNKMQWADQGRIHVAIFPARPPPPAPQTDKKNRIIT